MKKKQPESEQLLPVAGNGLLHRRAFLSGAGAVLGAAGLQMLTARPLAAAPAGMPASMLVPGSGVSPYGSRSHYESGIVRSGGSAPGTVGWNQT